MAMRVRSPFARRVLLFAVVPLAAACVFTSLTVTPQQTKPPAQAARVTSPVKAHLLDGSTVVFPIGIVILGDTVRPL